jgi:hypothetical protein
MLSELCRYQTRSVRTTSDLDLAHNLCVDVVMAWFLGSHAAPDSLSW